MTQGIAGLARPRFSKTKTLPNPTEYVHALLNDYKQVAIDEERAPSFRGGWRQAFGVGPEVPIDLEIGTGNGYHFAERANQFLERCLLGVELKYKPLIQTIRRAAKTQEGQKSFTECLSGNLNARIVRYDAGFLEDFIAPGEIDHVFVHHPDPWPRKRDIKHRLLNRNFLDRLLVLQRPGSFLEFKTDSDEYFEWFLEELQQSKYSQSAEIKIARDLHQSDLQAGRSLTHFEQLFLRQGVKIKYCIIQRPGRI